MARCACERQEAYHWAAEYMRTAPTRTPLIGCLPMFSFAKNQTRKKTKRKTRAEAK